MKKFLSVLSVIFVLLSFSACADNITENEKGTTEEFGTAAAEHITISENASLSVSSDESLASDSTHPKTTETTSKSAEHTTRKNTVAPSSTTAVTKPPETTTQRKTDSVTVSVNCGTILNNMKRLKKGKEYFVPANGIILSPTKVEIEKGDTAFDVLKKACQNNDIQFESVFTSGFNTYYIEGINQIYEKDCGPKSGWLFKVNGVFSSVGSSSCIVKNGDVIEFVYTCDLGEDVGAYI